MRKTSIVFCLLVLGLNWKAWTEPLASGVWHTPACSQVSGAGAVTFTKNDGRKLAPTTVPLHGIGYTFGLAALDIPDRLLAEHNGTILRSDDAGCTWSQILEFKDTLLTFAAAPGGKVFAWGQNTRRLAVINSAGAKLLVPPPVPSILGLGVDRARQNHLRLGGGNGAVWDSTDAGKTWKKVGSLPAVERGSIRLLYKFVFDPGNLDHIVAGQAVYGAFVTRDGGKLWMKSKGLSQSGGSVNVFNGVISPVDPSVVWVMGLDIGQLDNGAISGGRHIYRSEDGGVSFRPVVNQSPGVTLVNGPLMAAHPLNRNILYFEFGTSFANYGTDLFKYNYQMRRLTKTHNHYHGISSIVFSPADPQYLYLGLTVEEGVQ